MGGWAAIVGFILVGASIAIGCSKRHSPDPIPVILEPEAKDGGGTAALAMVLAYHGHQVGLDELRPLVATEEEGTCSALTIVKTARRYGLHAKGIKLEPRDIDDVPRGSILHWQGDYFVVYGGRDGARFRIIHPMRGDQIVAADDFRRLFTGVALVFDAK